jgi:Flp pilus assembly pilin Flp
LVEYVTIIALVVAAATAGLGLLGSNLNGAFSTAANGLETSLSGAKW